MKPYRLETILKFQEQDNKAILNDLMIAKNMSYHHRLLSRVYLPSTDREPITYNNFSLS